MAKASALKRAIKSLDSTRGLADADAEADERDAKERKIRTRIALDKIANRSEDTRPLNIAHVEALADSIESIGLIQGLATDFQGNLLAGGHRLAALRLLKENKPHVFSQRFSEGVPVVMFDVQDGQDGAMGRALEIELAENEKRRDYSRQEIRELANRLRDAGYRDSSGRPHKGQKSLGPALALVLGKNLRTVRRLLSEPGPVKDIDRACLNSKALLEKGVKAIRRGLALLDESGHIDEVRELRELASRCAHKAEEALRLEA